MKTRSAVFVSTLVRHHREKVTLLEPQKKTWVRKAPWFFMALGALLLGIGAFLGYQALAMVWEEEAVRAILIDIAKTRGLSEKLVPSVQGNPNLELAAILCALTGGILVFAGLSQAALLKVRHHEFTVGDNPLSSWVCSSKALPSSCFSLASLDPDGEVRFQAAEGMGGIVQLDDHQAFTLSGYLQRFGQTISPVVKTFSLDQFREVRLEHQDQVFVFSRTAPHGLLIPRKLATGLFGASLALTLVLGLVLAAYLTRLTDDPIFGDRVEAEEVTVRNLVKTPDLVAAKKQQLKEIQQKDQERVRQIHETKAETKDPTAPSRPSRDPQSSGPVTPGRVHTQAGIGVANVLASSVQAMTASLTANNTIFGQETENLSDLLGDGDPDGENPDGGFTGRGGPGGGPAGGLGNFGPPTTGWSGIFSGGPAGPPRFLPMEGARRREPILRDGRTDVSGKMDPNEVRAVIRAHRNEVHHCYQKGLLENDRAAGVVRVTFHLNPAGRAIDCRIDENLSVGSVGACICGRIQIWRFPQPEGGLARISYSWTLTPGGP